jgi:hypothetical protein
VLSERAKERGRGVIEGPHGAAFGMKPRPMRHRLQKLGIKRQLVYRDFQLSEKKRNGSLAHEGMRIATAAGAWASSAITGSCSSAARGRFLS